MHVHAEELRALKSPRDAGERNRYRAVQFAHQPRWQAYGEIGDSWFGFDAMRELRNLPQLRLIPLAGHTRGHVGIAVDTGNGWLLHASDAYFFHGQMQQQPHCPPGLALSERSAQADGPQRHRNAERLRELATNTDVTIFAAHSPVELHRHQSDGGSGHR
ncbi:MAG: hypothetical protein ACRDRA_21510 [Pseudonocardiaceae bacterium]